MSSLSFCGLTSTWYVNIYIFFLELDWDDDNDDDDNNNNNNNNGGGGLKCFSLRYILK
jgi:hypothetical protein